MHPYFPANKSACFFLLSINKNYLQEMAAMGTPETIMGRGPPMLAPLLSPPPPTPAHYKRPSPQITSPAVVTAATTTPTPAVTPTTMAKAPVMSDKDSSSDSDSGDSTESEEEESEDDAKDSDEDRIQFSLDKFIQQEAKLSPMPSGGGGMSSGMSTHTTDPSPRGGYPPTPSPLGGGGGGMLNHQGCREKEIQNLILI